MSAELFAIGDFSGIQTYVLDVKTAGNEQARRLRARSFLLELFERAALFELEQRFGVATDDVLVRGGGGFTVRLPAEADTAELEQLAADLQHRLWQETGGEVQFALGWGYGTTEAARTSLEHKKRQPARSMLQKDGQWAIADGEGPALPPPDGCDVCGHSRGSQVRTESEEKPDKFCGICEQAAQIGNRLTQWDWMRPDASGAGDVSALGVSFAAVGRSAPDAFRVGRWVPRRDDGRGGLLFREIAARGRGDQRLGVLKADVDDMGLRVGEVAGSDGSLRRLRDFSSKLHQFFGEGIQDLLERSYRSIYTVYAGGDDLLLLGPWDIMLDFAGHLRSEFQSGPGSEFQSGPGSEYHPLTFSAGVHLTHHSVPIRYGVDHAEELLERAKGQEGKNSCAALGTVWQWERHDAIIGDGKRLAGWVDEVAASRSLLHRLLQLAVDGADTEGGHPTAPGAGRGAEDKATTRALRAARWSYQVARNLPERRGERAAAAELRAWAEGALRFFDEPQGFIPYNEQDELAMQENNRRLEETAASLRYALLATRSGRGDTE